jgi:hypothetical protein
VSLTAWAAVTVFAAAYVLIATERIHRVAAALGGAVLMLLIGATDAEHAFFSEEAGIDWNVVFLLLGTTPSIAPTTRLAERAHRAAQPRSASSASPCSSTASSRPGRRCS